ncbi:Hypothetical predicted protein [Podarcis lilfordi]|uniref:Uncharacterized protein n=1 Tax=Podarcis lilfordi TaxID=74358 RepID=A0AA35LFN4_9SAUR|nr:Hypothetical predicted protein [Podarcis lilfordi]
MRQGEKYHWAEPDAGPLRLIASRFHLRRNSTATAKGSPCDWIASAQDLIMSSTEFAKLSPAGKFAHSLNLAPDLEITAEGYLWSPAGMAKQGKVQI